MEKNVILAKRFQNLSKKMGIIAAVSLVLFLIVNAINTGNEILYWISYILIMLTLVAFIQFIILYILGKFYLSKKG